MSKIAPTFESIFTKEYWDDAESMPPQPQTETIPKQVYKQMVSLTSQAATSVFEGNPTHKIPEGAAIDTSGDTLHTTPGTVLLVDMEMLLPLPFEVTPLHIIADSQRHPAFQAFIHDEADLMALPTTLFRNNSCMVAERKKETTVVLPYTKYAINTETDAIYSRIIRFLTYGTDKNGNLTYRLIVDWPKAHEKAVEGYGKRTEAIRDLLPVVDVGETYQEGEGEEEALFRVKSAEICLSGTIEYAKVKKKARGGRFAGRLATSASFGL